MLPSYIEDMAAAYATITSPTPSPPNCTFNPCMEQFTDVEALERDASEGYRSQKGFSTIIDDSIGICIFSVIDL